MRSLIHKQLAGWRNESGGWISTNVPNEHIYALFGESFAGTSKQIGEPFMHWIMQALPSDKQSDPHLFQIILAFAIYECLKKKGGAFIGKEPGDEGDNKNENNAGNPMQGGVTLSEYDPKEHQSKGCLSKFFKNWSYFWIYMELRKQYGPADLFENKKYSEYRKHFERRGEIYVERVAECHLQNGPKEPHWHVEQVAVHPSGQGQGLGKRMLRKLNELADANGKACYLETTGERNIHFYESLGYQVVGEFVLADPSDPSAPQCRGYGMVREPTKAL